MRDYLKKRLEAERESLKTYHATFGTGIGLDANVPAITAHYEARIAMLEEIMADLDEARIVMAKAGN